MSFWRGDDAFSDGNCPVSAFSQDDPSPDEFIILEHEPSPLNLDSVKRVIAYPPYAWEMKITGRVVARIMVSETGKYLKHIILKNPHPILTKEAERVLPMLRFRPCTAGWQAREGMVYPAHRLQDWRH
ncbi:MAG: energy transducer TonB [Bacteroidia bacterium]